MNDTWNLYPTKPVAIATARYVLIKTSDRDIDTVMESGAPWRGASRLKSSGMGKELNIHMTLPSANYSQTLYEYSIPALASIKYPTYFL